MIQTHPFNLRSHVSSDLIEENQEHIFCEFDYDIPLEKVWYDNLQG